MFTSNGSESRRISPPVKRRLVILAVSSFVSCVFFSSPLWNKQTSAYAPEYELPSYAVDLSPLTLTVHAPTPTNMDVHKDKPLLLKRIATPSFRDNLQPEVSYITSWPPVPDWSHQVVAFTNLIYLSLLTERVAIIPPFATMDHLGSTPYLQFGEIFDLVRLQREIEQPVLEWHQIKDPHSSKLDALGCWNTERLTWNGRSRNVYPHNLALDISYTPAPNWTKLVPDDADRHVSFYSLASLAFPDTNALGINDPEPSLLDWVSLTPDQHLLCFDDLSHVSARYPWEYSLDMSPAWRFVGQYMHWNPKIQHTADSHIRKALAIGPDDPIPPYIAVYARLGDPESWCDLPVGECFTPLASYARRVKEATAEIFKTKGIVVDRVLMTSDETASVWWDAVRKRGWSGPDYSKTTKRYGIWYPVLINAAIQSGAVAFISSDNTMDSVLAGKRVSSWQNGVVKRVLWETRRKPLEATALR
ncbi:hypothetical protein C8R43DRAFT_997506 [Mycena crocata]|nr:hypothetical protein C8R43DRAFT_997506 [Mycena crocata]